SPIRARAWFCRRPAGRRADNRAQPGPWRWRRAADWTRATGRRRQRSSWGGICGRVRETLRGGSTPGLTEQRMTPHAAATFGVLTELTGLRPPGPGAKEI